MPSNLANELLCLGALTANRRTRVRGLYDIHGSLKNDCIKSIFCNMCVLMQLDREIRARNGKTSLCTSADYIRSSNVVQLQPVAAPSMTYAPGSDRLTQDELHKLVLCRPPFHAQSLLRAQYPAGNGDERVREVVTVTNINHVSPVPSFCLLRTL